MLFPVMPAKAREVWETLRGKPEIEKLRLPQGDSLLQGPDASETLGPSKPLFPRIER
jgi:hypothetical protein